MSRRTPASRLGTAYHCMLQDSSILSVLQQHQIASVREAIAFIASPEFDELDIPQPQRRRLQYLIEPMQQDVPRVIEEGLELWEQWRELIADIFFFFEYLYEDGNGSASFWPADGFTSPFQHNMNMRLSPRDRENYDRNIAVRDSSNITRIEILQVLGLNNPQREELKRNAGLFTDLTQSQVAYTSLGMLNRTLQSMNEESAKIFAQTAIDSDLGPCFEERESGHIPVVDDERPPGVSSTSTAAAAPSAAEESSDAHPKLMLPQEEAKEHAGDVSPLPSPRSPRAAADPSEGLKLCAMEDGELVVRFFGMKEMDTILTSADVLISTVPLYSVKPKHHKISRSIPSVRVHRGFMRMYHAIDKGCLRDFGFDIVDSIAKRYWSHSKGEEKKRLVFTGHSMGAALASIAAFQLLLRYGEVDPEMCNSLLLITFGSPRFARSSFYSWHKRHLRHRHIHLVAASDSTVALPPPIIPGWHALGQRILLSPRALLQLRDSMGAKCPYEVDNPHFMYWHLVRVALVHPQ